MIVVDYASDHLIDLNINFDKYPICRGNLGILSDILANGVSKTILNDSGKVLAVISVFEIHPKVATVYIVPSEDAHGSDMRAFVRGVFSIRKELNCIVATKGYNRIETLTVNEEKHNRWMEYLGFTADGVKRCYGINGEDFIMWSRLWV